MSNQPYSEQLRIAREEYRDLKHRAKLLKDALVFMKAKMMRETGLGITAAKAFVESHVEYQNAIGVLRDAEKERDLASGRVLYLKELLEDAREHDRNRRAEMRL